MLKLKEHLMKELQPLLAVNLLVLLVMPDISFGFVPTSGFYCPLSQVLLLFQLVLLLVVLVVVLLILMEVVLVLMW